MSRIIKRVDTINCCLICRAYDDAAEEDLFEGLERAIEEDNVLDPELDLFEMLYSWTRQAGFPLLTVERNYATGEVTFSQERYLSAPTNPPPTSVYWIPITYAFNDNANFSNTQATIWMGTPTLTVTIPNLSPDDWFVVNIQQAGYYRVQYDQTNCHLLADAMLRNISLFHVANRAHLLDDLYNLARTNRASFATALMASRFLEHDTTYISWYPAITLFNYIDTNFQGHLSYSRFRVRVTILLQLVVLSIILLIQTMKIDKK